MTCHSTLGANISMGWNCPDANDMNSFPKAPKKCSYIRPWVEYFHDTRSCLHYQITVGSCLVGQLFAICSIHDKMAFAAKILQIDAAYPWMCAICSDVPVSQVKHVPHSTCKFDEPKTFTYLCSHTVISTSPLIITSSQTRTKTLTHTNRLRHTFTWCSFYTACKNRSTIIVRHI